MEDIHDADCVILAVAHREYRSMSLEAIDKLYADMPANDKVLIDVKSILDRQQVKAAGYRYWRL